MHEGNLVILAGGLSSRMQSSVALASGVDPETRLRILDGGKTMVGVDAAGRPLVEYIVGNAIAAGYRNVVLLLGVRNQALRMYMEQRRKEGAFPGVSWTFATQSIPQGRTKPPGTADALLTALRAVPAWEREQCTVCNGDNLYSVRALRLLRTSNATHALIDYDRAALRFSQERIQQFAVLLKDNDGYLRRIIEKPSAQDLDVARDHTGRIGVSMNLFRFTCGVIIPFLEAVPLHPQRQEKELPAAVAALLAADPHAMQAIPLSEHVPDLTDAFDISIMREFFASPPTSS
jgi:NDP-sugar pyrophosphorylase family protein